MLSLPEDMQLMEAIENNTIESVRMLVSRAPLLITGENMVKPLSAGWQGSVTTNLFDSRFVDTDRSEAVLNLLGVEYSHRRCVHQVGVDL